MKDTLASIWKLLKGVITEETNIPSLFVFKFIHEMDLQRVLDTGPWTFNNHFLMSRNGEEEVGEQLSEINLAAVYIRLQVYDLPICFNSEFIL